jgi:hypothetical protein
MEVPVRVGIILGISKYLYQSSLPACKADSDVMRTLLTKTEQYDKLLFINENKESHVVKSKISQFVKKLMGKKIEEFFFYYTGHGDYFENEFYYLLTDYKEAKRKQTSLENSEIDNMIRSLNPELTVKVIDACHAGITYVKDSQPLEDLLTKSKNRFKKCYFMFSSQLDQSSYQDESLSFFTRSFIRSITNHNSDLIRYKDIMDFISDEFYDKPEQTPFFIIQADFTEVFCSINPELQNSLLSGKTSSSLEENTKIDSRNRSNNLVDNIIIDSDKYCGRDTAIDILEDLREQTESYTYNKEFRALYDVEYSFQKYFGDLPNEEVLGKWLEKSNVNYFAEVRDHYYEEEIPTETFFGIKKYRKKIRRQILGLTPTSDVPYHLIQIRANAKYPNISTCNCSIVIILSKTLIRLFYFFSDYNEISWNSYRMKDEVNWQSHELNLKEKENISSYFKELQTQFENWKLEDLREIFGAKT